MVCKGSRLDIGFIQYRTDHRAISHPLEEVPPFQVGRLLQCACGTPLARLHHYHANFTTTRNQGHRLCKRAPCYGQRSYLHQQARPSKLHLPIWYDICGKGELFGAILADIRDIEPVSHLLGPVNRFHRR